MVQDIFPLPPVVNEGIGIILLALGIVGAHVRFFSFQFIYSPTLWCSALLLMPPPPPRSMLPVLFWFWLRRMPKSVVLAFLMLRCEAVTVPCDLQHTDIINLNETLNRWLKNWGILTAVVTQLSIANREPMFEVEYVYIVTYQVTLDLK